MPTLSQSPALPVPGRPAKLRFTLTQSGANFVRVWLTDAPQGSKHRAKLDQEDFTRDPVYSGPGGKNAELRFEPDIGGAYVFAAQEYTQGAAPHGGRYQDDPDTHQTETKAGGEATLTLYVATRLTQTLGAQPDTATLVVYVLDDTVKETTIAVHGEDSPAIQEPQTQAARVAALGSSTQTALSALIGKTVAALDDPSAAIDDLIDQLNAHRTQAGVHAADDNDNTIDASFTDPTGPKGVIEATNEFLTKLRLHMRNANSSDSAIGSQGYHAPGAVKKADLLNLTLIDGAGSLGQAIAGAADGWRAYEAHRVRTAVHNAADSTNLATALPPVMEVHRAFMESIRQANPTAPATESSAAIMLVQTLGFEETPL